MSGWKYQLDCFNRDSMTRSYKVNEKIKGSFFLDFKNRVICQMHRFATPSCRLMGCGAHGLT